MNLHFAARQSRDARGFGVSLFSSLFQASDLICIVRIPEVGRR